MVREEEIYFSILQNLHAASGAHPASRSMGFEGVFPGVKENRSRSLGAEDRKQGTEVSLRIIFMP
jgi:hypothetical protein